VDSNVLISSASGRTARVEGAGSAVDQGFKRAFLTIIDTQRYNDCSAAFLFIFGLPVRGFA